MINRRLRASIILTLAVLLTLCGVLGMAASFIYFASEDPRDLAHTGRAFIAGAILVAGGIIASAIVVAKD